MKTTTLDLIRHGEPAGGRMYRGNGTDHPLSELGWQQMRDAVQGDKPWDRIISSPMARCIEFARELSTQTDLQLDIEPQIIEVGMGQWEGKTPTQVKELWPDDYAAYYQKPGEFRPRDAEQLNDLKTRISASLESFIQKYAGQHVLVVCHAGVIRASLGYVLQSELGLWYRSRIDYAGITSLSHDEHGWKLISHNC